LLLVYLAASVLVSSCRSPRSFLLFFVFTDTITIEASSLSLHDALPISNTLPEVGISSAVRILMMVDLPDPDGPTRKTNSPSSILDRKSTRLHSSHVSISYAVFCLKKKNTIATVYTVLRR